MAPVPGEYSAPRGGTPQQGGPPVAISATPTTATPPLPKRPKGRAVISLLMLSVFAAFAFVIYESFVHYAAYGEVVGRKIQVAAPWDGVVSALHVRVGDEVRQGDVLLNVESIAMRHRMEEIEDSLNLERARLSSEVARLKWEAERVKDTAELVKADYYEKWSELLWEESVLTDITHQLNRAVKLQREGAVAQEHLDSLKYRVAGKEKRIAQLTEAVDRLKRRMENDLPIDPALDDQIKPSLVRIENLQGELSRVRQLLNRGVVTCPTNGLVTRINKFAGEHAGPAESIIELLVDGSKEIVIYVPQASSNQWSVGDPLEVSIEPENRSVPCEVVQVAPEMRPAPRSIMRHYAADESLLPMIVRPIDTSKASQLVLGSKVRLPRRGPVSHAGTIVESFRDPSQVAATERIPDVDAFSSDTTGISPESNPTSTASLR
jgi:multidrug resistance efflux pump